MSVVAMLPQSDLMVKEYSYPNLYSAGLQTLRTKTTGLRQKKSRVVGAVSCRCSEQGDWSEEWQL